MRLLVGTLGDLGEQIGGTLVPYMMAFKDAMLAVTEKIAPWIEAHKTMIGLVLVVGTAFTALLAALGPIMFLVGKAVIVFKVLGAVILAITSPVGIVIAAIVALGVVLGRLVAKSEWGGKAIASVGSFMADTWKKIVDDFRWVAAYTGAVLSNWSASVDLAINTMLLGFVSAFENIKHWLTVAMPGYLDWFYKYSKGIWDDVVNYLAHVMLNAWKNVEMFFNYITSWLSDDPAKWEWTALSTGFERTLKEKLPEIAERELSALEHYLSTEIGKGVGTVMDAAIERYKEKTQAGLLDWFDKMEMAVATGQYIDAFTGRESSAAAAGAKAGPESTANEAAETVRAASAQFESVTAAFSRIASAAAGRTREEELAQKQLDQTQILVDETKKGWGGIKEKLVSVGDQISEAVGDQSGVAVFGV